MPDARSPRDILFPSVLLSEFLLSVAGGGVEVRGEVATGGVFKELTAFMIGAWRIDGI